MQDYNDLQVLVLGPDLISDIPIGGLIKGL